jgi:hypothetical protein
LKFGPVTAQFNVLDAHLRQSFSSVASPADAYYADGSLENSDVAEMVDKDPTGSFRYAREPRKDPIKLNRVEEIIAKLVTQLLVTSKALSTASADGQDNSLQMREMADRLAALQSDSRQVPEYSWLRNDSVRVERERLHRALLTIFQKTESGNSPTEVTVAKICYNLLVTTAPPSVETYNILVRGFARLQQYELGEVVIRSFFKGCIYKPNTATARIFLEHYSAKGDVSGFRDIVRRIVARDGIDMRVTKIPIQLLWMKKNRLWARLSTANATRHGRYVHRRLLRTKGVFDSIIQGILKLEGIPSTTVYVKAAMQMGNLTASTISKLVSTCVESRDVRSGRLLLYAILGHPKKGYFEPGALNNFKDAQDALYDLLHLCGIDASSYNTWGDKLIDIRHRRALGHLIYHLRMWSIERAVRRVSAMTEELQTILRIGKRRGVRQRARMTTYNRALVVLNRRPQYCGPSAKRDVKDSVVSKVEKLVLYRCAVMGTIQKRVFHIYYERLPLFLQQKYRWLRKSTTLTEAGKLNWIYQFFRSKVLLNLMTEVFKLESTIASIQNAVAAIYWKKLPLYLQEKLDTVLRKENEVECVTTSKTSLYLPRKRLDNIYRFYRTYQINFLIEEVLRLESTIANMQNALSSIYYSTLPPQHQVKVDALSSEHLELPSKKVQTIFDLYQESGQGELRRRPRSLSSISQSYGRDDEISMELSDQHPPHEETYSSYTPVSDPPPSIVYRPSRHVASASSTRLPEQFPIAG